MCVCVYKTKSLQYSRNQHNIVSQLFLFKKVGPFPVGSVELARHASSFCVRLNLFLDPLFGSDGLVWILELAPHCLSDFICMTITGMN